MFKALVILADGFEDVEAVAPIDILRRGGVRVDVASLDPSRGAPVSAHGLAVAADGPLSAFAQNEYDAIILPGGGKGTENLRASAEVAALLRRQKEAGRWICAICAAPSVLAAADVLGDARYTCYPGVESLVGRPAEDAATVVDGRIITARGPGAAFDFGFEILRRAVSAEAARKVAEGMLAV